LNTHKKHIIQTSNLSIGYAFNKKTHTVAQNLNIDLDKGNLVCLLGKNGIGKSTLLRTITKVQPALHGDIYINDRNLKKFNNLDLSKSLSLVLTERLPESNLSVFELVALGRHPYTNWVGKLTDNDFHLIKTAFDQTNTGHLMKSKYYELSDGQLQKVLIARALAQNTDIIILDEPTAHLDIHHTIETFTLLKKLAKEFHKTIIVSTHEINLALQLADVLWLMTPTKFVSGETEKLIANNYVEKLFESNLISFNKTLKQFTISNSL
jgi:iron complex transport system ATP-binding protein